MAENLVRISLMRDAQLNYLDLLPHRPPMRLLDEVIELVPGERAFCVRRTKASDFYFDGHFPGLPVVPAIILVELIAQAGGLAAGAPGGGRLPPSPRLRRTGQPAFEQATPPLQLRVAAFGPFKFPAAAGADALLEIRARVVGKVASFYKIEGDVRCGATVVASGSVTLAHEATASR
jgi:3-hydroxyacyl-[acyl-carrier-protein] dehydratase